MDNKAYVDLVNKGEFPEDIQVPIDKPFIDDRGTIINLWLGKCGSTTLITSKKGSRRANHHHEGGDWHAAYVVSGKIKYTEANIDGSNKKEYEFNAGDCFISPPMKWHLMEFLEDTVFITMNGIMKNHENYEKTVVRKDF